MKTGTSENITLATTESLMIQETYKPNCTQIVRFWMQLNVEEDKTSYFSLVRQIKITNNCPHVLKRGIF